MNSIWTFNKSLHDFQRNPEDHLDIRSYMVYIYRERMLVVTTRATDADRKKITGALLGGSTRRLISTAEYIGLPMAVNSLDASGEVFTELEKCKKITRDYFQGLYHHIEPPELPKPWMECPSVSNVKNVVSQDPFIWPKLANVDDFRAMVRRGNN
jgi:hypothetical protein